MEITPMTSVLPPELWGVILAKLQFYDIIFLRATSSALFKWCKEFKPFPKYFVLDQNECVEYLVKNGYISCLDYVKDVLHFEWIFSLTSLAIIFGRLDVLDHFVQNGLEINQRTALLECTQGTCSLEMIKYLHQCGVKWDQASIDDDETDDLDFNEDNYPYKGRQFCLQTPTVMESMAYHGHLDCIKYAMENGCTERMINYTPSIECLDFAMQNGFSWSDKPMIGNLSVGSICVEAARLGDLTMLKYAHQHGAPLNHSASEAAKQGHLECLMYAAENSQLGVKLVDKLSGVKTLKCFKYVVQQCGLEVMKQHRGIWHIQLRLQNMDVLRFMLDNDFPIPREASRYLYAAATTYETFKFLLDEAKVPCDGINPYYEYARRGNLEALKLAFERNLPNKSVEEINAAQQRQQRIGIPPPPPLPPMFGSMNQLILQAALVSGNLDVVRLVCEKIGGFDLNAGKIFALKFGTPEILDFMAQQGVTWTSGDLIEAKEASNLPNVAYLTRQSGCSWSEVSTGGKSPIIVKYAKDHGWVPKPLISRQLTWQ